VSWNRSTGTDLCHRIGDNLPDVDIDEAGRAVTLHVHYSTRRDNYLYFNSEATVACRHAYIVRPKGECKRRD
jgi:hypothetical protein